MENLKETMSGSKMIEEIDCGNFFDQIDDLLEFPNDDVEKGLGDNGVALEYNDFPPVFWSENSPVFSAADSNSDSDLSAQLSVPYEDIVQLEWLSTFVEDSFSGGGLTLEKCELTSTKDSWPNQFQTSSPISVLESSSASSIGKTLHFCHEKRARSKRPRPATFNPLPHLITPTETTHRALFTPYSTASWSQSDHCAESRPLKKEKKIKILTPSEKKETSQNNQNENPNANAISQPLRKCIHCEITKTPQWRSGPMGPKTLCNACGVRYKSGRLFPEYRPAASPTFIPSLHSNSHKKVLQMRTKITEEKPVVTSVASSFQQPDLLPSYM